jgi:hypothetical protein
MLARELHQAARTSSPRFFFCKVISGLSALSATVISMVSSSSASVRRRRAERLEARNREQPRGNGGTAFKASGLLPHVEETPRAAGVRQRSRC